MERLVVMPSTAEPLVGAGLGSADPYSRMTEAIQCARSTRTSIADATELQRASSFFASSLQLLEAADQTEWHPDRRRYRFFTTAATDLAAAAIEFAQVEKCLASAEAAARGRESTWQSDLRPRREWTRLIRIEAAAIAGALYEAGGQRDALIGRLQEVVTLCIEMIVWLETRGRSHPVAASER